MSRNRGPARAFLAAEARQARRFAVLPVALGIAGGLTAIVQAWLVAGALADVLLGAPAAALVPAIAGAAVLVLLRAGLAAWQEAAAFSAGAALRQDLRARLFARIEALGPAWTEARQSGALASALVERTEALEGFFARWLPAVTLAAVLPLAAGLIAFGIDATVGIGLLLLPPLTALALAIGGIGAARAAGRQFAELGRMGAHFLDRMRGLGTLVVLNQQDAEAARIATVADEFRHRTMAVLRVAVLTSALFEAVFVTAVALVSLRAGLSLHAGTMELHHGLFLLLLVPEMFVPMRALLGAYHDRQQAAGASEALAAMLAEPVPVAGSRALVDPSRAEIVFQGVTVRYPGRDAPALRNFSFRAAPGECVVLMGPSGAGKSTVLDLLLGLRAPDAGLVALNGVPIHALSPAARAEAITWIGSRPKLFSGTLRDNLLLARPDASDAELRRAAEAAHLGEVLARLPNGFDSRVGEGGFGLSGGEAQRVAIARAWLRDTRLLLLDEPTAHLDPDTEALVLESLRLLAAGRTVIMATHSPAASLSGRVIMLGAAPEPTRLSEMAK
jgi:ATP-binding cassette subfamily C protein CydD